MIKFAGSRQQGVALIMVLLAMALVVLMASGMTRQQSLRVLPEHRPMGLQQLFIFAGMRTASDPHGPRPQDLSTLAG